MKHVGFSIAGLAVLSLAVAPALAQGTNAGKPAAPAPSKATPLGAGGKPQTTKPAGGGGAMMKKKHK